MHIRLVEKPGEWWGLVAASPDGNILQSYEWGEFKAAFGWRPIRLAVEDGGRLLLGAQMLLRRSPLGAVAYVPRGPLGDVATDVVVDHLLAALHEQARAAGAFFLKVEPEGRSSPALAAQLAAGGFRPGAAVQPRSTIVVDLQGEPEALAARLSRRTRYNIRLAERKGLRCQPGSTADLPEFYRLLAETARRAHFFVHPPDYYRELWGRFAPGGMAHLMLVRQGDEALAATMFFTVADRAYQLYTGSSAGHRQLKPNELLQWSALLHARALGCRTYDLWGIPDEVGRCVEEGTELPPTLRGDSRTAAGTMQGVYLFKRGFGGTVIRTAGAYDYAYAPARYWLWERGLPACRHVLALVAERTRTRGRVADSSPVEAYET